MHKAHDLPMIWKYTCDRVHVYTCTRVRRLPAQHIWHLQPSPASCLRTPVDVHFCIWEVCELRWCMAYLWAERTKQQLQLPHVALWNAGSQHRAVSACSPTAVADRAAHLPCAAHEDLLPPVATVLTRSMAVQVKQDTKAPAAAAKPDLKARLAEKAALKQVR